MGTIENAIKELNENSSDDYADMNDPEDSPVTGQQKKFAASVYDLIQGIIDSEVVSLPEEFTSRSSLHRHFEAHCLGSRGDRRSTHTNVYYDFTKVSQYEEYEQQVIDQLDTRPTIRISSLYDTEKVIEGFRKLFEGGQTITFLALCGFENSTGPVIISFRSFANSVTQNYEAQNTLDCIVRSITAKTTTLYPVAADRVETKFNGFVQNYTEAELEPFSINH